MNFTTRRSQREVANASANQQRRQHTQRNLGELADAPPVSPIVEAMRRLEPSAGKAPLGPTDQPSLVQQLYALALLNREDAMRRLNGRLPVDMILSQQPPSLLALTGSVEPGMQPPPTQFKSARPITAPNQKTRGGMDPTKKRRATDRPPKFGSVGYSLSGGVEAIAAARAPSLAVTAMGSPGPMHKLPHRPMTSHVGGTSSSPLAPNARSFGHSSPDLSNTTATAGHHHAAAPWAPDGRSQTAPYPGRHPPSKSSAGTGRAFTPISMNDCESFYPTLASTLPQQRAMARAEAEAKARAELLSEHDRRRKLGGGAHPTAESGSGEAPGPTKLPVRMLLEGEAPLMQDARRLQTVASATAPSPGMSRSSMGGNVRFQKSGGNPRYVPDPRLSVRNRPDPWKASEEDMWLREQQELRKDEMNQVRMAAAVAAGTVPGFG